MKRLYLAVMSLALTTAIHPVLAQVPPSSGVPASSAAVTAEPRTSFDILRGRWVRPDGGYVISIKAVDAGGKLDAGYSNPNQLPFQRAEVTRDGDALNLFFELRAGGYNGSTYTLNYDAARDQLRGVYYQAVARQKFQVVFSRAK